MPAQAATSTSPVNTNDTFLSKQWYLDSINARQAWNSATGSPDVIVAVIDSGLDPNHPDIKSNLWTNPGEIAGNNKDDDGDGYVDDVHGWNFLTASGDVRPVYSPDGLFDAWLHGTAVSSLIAAVGNNDMGIAGVAWQAKIMPLVVLSPSGYGRDEDITAAIRYAVSHGADIINLSFVGYDFDASLQDAIREATAQGVLVVSAAGNSDDSSAGDNLDSKPGYPACDKGAAGRGALSVSALNKDLTKTAYANYGACVDVSAPGNDVFAARPAYDPVTLEPAAGYLGGLSGTSVAAPLVSGLAALLKAEHPSWTAVELAERITQTADPIMNLPAALNGKLGSGIINAAHAVQRDAASQTLGPLFLETAKPGQSPEVRVVTEDGTELHRFFVGNQGDKRGVRAAFIRWSGKDKPEIVATTIGDATGGWRIYRLDGVLVAAGSEGTDINGGLYLAAQDLDSNGHDTLFLGEANGRRAWLASQAEPVPAVFTPFAGSKANGISALSVTRPKPSFLVTSKFQSGQLAIIGQGGVQLAAAQSTLKLGAQGWLNRRALAKQGGAVYDILSPDGQLVFVNDASGLHVSQKPINISHWTQIPDGENEADGWRYFETWPR